MGGTHRHKPAHPLLAAEWRVANVSPQLGRALIARYHYARGASNTVTACHGLYRRSDNAVMGVAWWIPPTRGAAGAFWADPEAVLSLSRLVVLPDAPTNAASFLLMRSAALLDGRWKCLATWADTERGHTGRIYRAAGWEYLGLSVPTDVWVDADGRRVARKRGPSTRTRAEMTGLGHVFLGNYAKHRYRLVRTRLPKAVQPALFEAAT